MVKKGHHRSDQGVVRQALQGAGLGRPQLLITTEAIDRRSSPRRAAAARRCLRAVAGMDF